MRELRLIIVVFLASTVLVACRSHAREPSEAFNPGSEQIQIVLFHLEKRCESCNAVESETQMVLDQNFKDECSSGAVRLVSLNFQSMNGKEAAALLKASGQSLFIVKGDTIIDLSSEAFMFAHTQAKRYRNVLKKEIGNLL